MLIQESFIFKNKLFASGFESIFGSEFYCVLNIIYAG